MKKQKFTLNEEISQIQRMMRKINEQSFVENINDNIDNFEKSEDIDYDNVEVKVGNINFDNKDGHMLFASNGEFIGNKNSNDFLFFVINNDIYYIRNLKQDMLKKLDPSYVNIIRDYQFENKEDENYVKNLFIEKLKNGEIIDGVAKIYNDETLAKAFEI